MLPSESPWNMVNVWHALKKLILSCAFYFPESSNQRSSALKLSRISTTTLNQWSPTSSVKSLILKSTIEDIISAIPGWSSKSCNHDINPWSQVPLTDISFLCCKSPWALARHAELHCLVLNKSNSHGSIGPHSWPFQKKTSFPKSKSTFAESDVWAKIFANWDYRIILPFLGIKKNTYLTKEGFDIHCTLFPTSPVKCYRHGHGFPEDFQLCPGSVGFKWRPNFHGCPRPTCDLAGETGTGWLSCGAIWATNMVDVLENWDTLPNKETISEITSQQRNVLIGVCIRWTCGRSHWLTSFRWRMENGEDITKQHFGIHRQNHGGITPSFFMSGVMHGLYTYISIYIIISVHKTLYTVITSNHPANRLSLSLSWCGFEWVGCIIRDIPENNVSICLWLETYPLVMNVWQRLVGCLRLDSSWF